MYNGSKEFYKYNDKKTGLKNWTNCNFSWNLETLEFENFSQLKWKPNPKNVRTIKL